MRVFQKYGMPAAVMLLVTAAALLYVAASGLMQLHPAADYEDRGVKTFYLHIAVANGHCCGAKQQSGGHSGIPLFAKPYAAKGSLHE